MATTDLTNSGAVKGAAIDTSPTTNKTTAIGLGTAVVGIAGAVWAAVAKDPTAIHWAGILGGAVFGSTGSLGAILAHVRAMEAEAEHAIETVASDVKAVDPGFEAAVQAEVGKRLQAAGIAISTHSVQ